MEASASASAAEAAYTRARASRFSFKPKPDERPSRSKRAGEDTRRHGPSRRHGADGDRGSKRSRRHRHRRARDDFHPTSTRGGEYYDPDHRRRESLFDGIDPAEAASPAPKADDAFLESLFDALADDEGAAYWEGVYGQPVHVYPDTRPGPHGKLERMTDDEYADYVRTKMWEKSHQHILEEREAKETARRLKKEQRAHADEHIGREEQERDHIRQQMEESLRRGAERKKAKEAAAAWHTYTKRWEHLKSAQNMAQHVESSVLDLIPWPVASGMAKHVNRDDIERFLRSSSAWKADPSALLKVERVRWHPDKIQQRFGQHIDADTMKSVTAVFQVIDRLWTERR